MKIFYCAVFDNLGSMGYGADNAKLRELENLGHLVMPYNYRIRGEQLDKNPLRSHRRDEEIVEFCINWSPDFIIFSKCNGIDNSVFTRLKQIAPLCYWFADPLVTYENREFYEKTRIADFFLCDKKNVLDKAFEFNEHCFLVTDGFDRLLEKPRGVKKDINVSFIGNLYGDRQEKIKKINNKVEIISGVYGEDHSYAVSRSKINLNFCTTDGQSDRVFKVLAAGGFLLTDDWPDREEFFDDGKDLVVYKDFEDLNKKIKYYLENPREREEIAKSGNKKVQKYNRREWAKKTISIFNSFSYNPRENKDKKETILIAGPWVGEFGWELFCWHGYIRSLSRFYDKTVCISNPTSRFLYEDFCDEYIEYTPDGGDYRDSYYKVGFKVDQALISKFVKELSINHSAQKVSLMVPRRIGDPPRTHFEERFQFGALYVKPLYKKFGNDLGLKNRTIVIHARNRKLRPEDNWPREKWENLVKKLIKSCYNVISIGMKSCSMHIEGTEDKRECDQQELLDLLASSEAILGPSSGPMCLGSLCGCPQVVWTTDYNIERFTKNWNPFDTKVLMLVDHGWQPSAEYVKERYFNWENKDEI